MNYDLQRHRLLKELSINRLQFEIRDKNFKGLGINFDILYKKLNCNQKQFKEFTSELYDCKEIQHCNDKDRGILGVGMTQVGYTAYSNNKYKKRLRVDILNFTKDVVQIVIPVLSLLIAFIAITGEIYDANKEYKKELQKLESKMQLLQMRIDTIQTHTKIFHQLETTTDSLNR